MNDTAQNIAQNIEKPPQINYTNSTFKVAFEVSCNTGYNPENVTEAIKSNECVTVKKATVEGIQTIYITAYAEAIKKTWNGSKNSS